jgi:hypothetical protein
VYLAARREYNAAMPRHALLAAAAAPLLGCVAPATQASPPAPAQAPLVIVVITGDAAPAVAAPDEVPPEATPEAVAEAPAAAPAPAPKAAPPPRPRDVALAPRWRGTWRDVQGHRYAFDLSLQRHAGGRVEGRFDWQLLEAPQGSRLALRVNETGSEHVRGAYNSRTRRLDLAGYAVENPILVATDRYRIMVDDSGKTFRGLSLGGGDAWSSTLEGRAAR